MPTRRVLSVGSLREFIDVEVAGGLVLLAGAVLALVWANLGEPGQYEGLWRSHLRLGAGPVALDLELRHWINDLLMALFFFVVGLEIKRELVDGELRGARRAALPAIAALGGMVAPALIYLALNPAGAAASGWGIPMATDIAFAVGVLALFGKRIPLGLKVFLLSLAIVDDIGAIAVIAVFYSANIGLLPLVLSAASVAAFAASWRVSSTLRRPLLPVLAAAAWVALYASGVHPTIAGVALGLCVPAGTDPDPSPAERLGHSLHPWTSFGIVPVFALANAGVALPAGGLAAALGHPVAAGAVAGLLIGKLLGISLASYLAVRTGLAVLPSGVGWGSIVGVAALGGIGFTVSLFITELAFTERALADAAKVGVLAGSTLAAALGCLLLMVILARTNGDGSWPDTTVGEGAHDGP